MFLLEFVTVLAMFAFMAIPSSSASIPENTYMDAAVVRRDYKNLPDILADVTTASSAHLEALSEPAPNLPSGMIPDHLSSVHQA